MTHLLLDIPQDRWIGQRVRFNDGDPDEEVGHPVGIITGILPWGDVKVSNGQGIPWCADAHDLELAPAA